MINTVHLYSAIPRTNQAHSAAQCHTKTHTLTYIKFIRITKHRIRKDKL